MKKIFTMRARDYLAVLTYSLTSLNNIESFVINFEEGDHAVPGKYSRINFFDLWPL